MVIFVFNHWCLLMFVIAFVVLNLYNIFDINKLSRFFKTMKILPIYDIFKLTQTWNYNVSVCRHRPNKSFLRIWLDEINVFC